MKKGNNIIPRENSVITFENKLDMRIKMENS